MALIRVSETEAVNNIASLLAQARNGAEIEIEGDGATIALVPRPEIIDEPDPGYDEWFRAEVQAGMDCDPATDFSEEEAEAYFAEKRQALLVRMGEPR